MRVRGTLDGVEYTIDLTKGKLTGSKRVAALLDLRAGTDVLVTPAGPLVKVSLDNEWSVLAALSDPRIGKVREATGLPAGSPVPPRPAHAVP